jgi:hypothetical protein
VEILFSWGVNDQESQVGHLNVAGFSDKSGHFFKVDVYSFT